MVRTAGEWRVLVLLGSLVKWRDSIGWVMEPLGGITGIESLIKHTGHYAQLINKIIKTNCYVFDKQLIANNN